ncbi:Large ribosomal subunit protein [Trichinella spiralis]|uniref:Large ribosomal subunit protein n=1 Tax=Trichinella spiralis TaxID=6334 RepID=A0ABR3KLK7_TRISP
MRDSGLWFILERKPLMEASTWQKASKGQCHLLEFKGKMAMANGTLIRVKGGVVENLAFPALLGVDLLLNSRCSIHLNKLRLTMQGNLGRFHPIIYTEGSNELKAKVGNAAANPLKHLFKSQVMSIRSIYWP